MMDKNKIGIMTYYAVKNYGAALQAFALQQSIKSLGGNPEFLRYFDKHNESNALAKRSLFAVFRNNPLKLARIILNYKQYFRTRERIKLVNADFSNFRNEYLNISREPYYDSDDLKEANKLYTGFVTGSDMVWTPIGQNLDAYFLQFADKSKRFSYAPSMTGCNSFSDQNKCAINSYLRSFRMLSCREQEGVDYVKQLTGLDASLTVDPTLLLTKDEWIKELSLETKIKNRPYILCYLFKGLPESIEKEVFRIAKERDMEVRYIPLSPKEFECELNNDYCGPYGPREFVELFINARFIVTNSFHGFLFSLIAEKPFVVIHREKNNLWKANESRISNLMMLLGITDRYIEPFDSIANGMLDDMDYSNITTILKRERIKSLSYLKLVVESCRSNSLSTNDSKIKNVRDLSNKKCTGCNVCSLVCPFEAIKMEEDGEGFIFPRIDEGKCRECGMCAKKCPSLNTLPKVYPNSTYLCLSNDKAKSKSASGGVFITLAKYFITSLNGVVYGAVLDDKLQCKHMEATTLDQLTPMQNSKYIQSEVGDIYEKAKKRLIEGRNVLFSGTPCQIAGLKSFLGRDYANLLTIEVVCHGVPNQKFWNIYLKDLNKKGIVKQYIFRNRENKASQSVTSRVPRRGTQEATIVASWGISRIPALHDPFYGPFVKCESYRQSCYYCQYAHKERVADLTMGDCDSDKLYPDFYPEQSKSILLVNTEKGKSIWKSIDTFFEYIQLDYDKETVVNTPLRYPSVKPVTRDILYKDLNILKFDEFKKRYSHKPSIFKNIISNIIKI